MDDLLRDNTTLLIAAAGGATIVLVLLMFLLFRKRSPDARSKRKPVAVAASKTAPEPSVASSENAGNEGVGGRILVENPEKIAEREERESRVQTVTGVLTPDWTIPFRTAWCLPMGGDASGVLEGETLQLGMLQSARSRAHLSAEPGNTYRLEFRVRAIADSTNDAANNFFVGPMFLDSEGRVLVWFREQRPISIAEGDRSGTVDTVAPEGAVSVHIGLQGNFSSTGRHGNGAVAFSNLQLTKV